ncbi:MAG: ribokinase [Erysipelotrichales bacterium]|nr:ribokinase [Erysipelotrichales bacterium]
MNKKVAVFGSFVVDLMSRAPHFPLAGETVKGSLFQMGPGGKGFNQCVAAHKAQADVTMIGKVGNDDFANVFLKVMDNLNMNKDYVFVANESSTGTALIIVNENTSQNEIVIVPGANNQINSNDIEQAKRVIKECDYVLLQLEVNQDANEEVAHYAKENNCKVILNTAPYSKISDEFLSNIYMVTPNEIEAAEYTGITIDSYENACKAAEIFKAKGVEIVVITLGERGVFVSTNEKNEIIPAYHVSAIDTTGAGDAFNGGLLAALSKDKDIFEACRYGNAVAALSVQKLGTTMSMPTYEEIEHFLKMEEQN